MNEKGMMNIKLIGGADVFVDFSQRRAACRRCGKSIRFGITKNSKYMPIIETQDGWQAHFTDCKSNKSIRTKTVERQMDEMDRERENFNF